MSAGSGSRIRVLAVALILAAVAAGGITCWRIVRLAATDLHAHSDPARALQWRSSNPEALIALAAEEARLGDFKAAGELARRAIDADPLDGRGYRVLADAVGGQGDRAERMRLLALAVKHAPRDIAARAWAAQIALERGDAVAAVAHYDRILRVAPAAATVLFPVVVQLAATPGARDAVIDELSQEPAWRTSLLQQFARTAPSADDLTPVFDGLRRRGGLVPEETAAYVGRFVQDHRWDDAFVHWAANLPREQLAALASPVDGGFENQASGSGAPFEWNIRSLSGVEVAVRASPDGRGRALWLEFQGRRSAFRDVRQLLRLQSRREYRLQWRSRLDRLETPRGLHWTITCAEGKSGRILATTPEAGTSRWRTKSERFSVPDGCGAQWLVLELDARIPAETLALGSAWFDDVSVGEIPTQARLDSTVVQ